MGGHVLPCESEDNLHVFPCESWGSTQTQIVRLGRQTPLPAESHLTSPGEMFHFTRSVRTLRWLAGMLSPMAIVPA